MPKFAKPILIAAAILVAVGGLIVLGANIYLQSAAVQERIRNAVSEAVQAPVSIRSTAFTPWSGLSVTGVVIPNDGIGRLPLLDVASVGMKWNLWSVLRGRFVIDEIVVKGPVLNAYQQANGSWSRPAKVTASTPDTMVSGPAVSAQAPAVATAPTSPRPPAIALEKVSIQDGEAYFDNANGRRFANMKDIDVTIHSNEDGSFSGKFSIGEVELFGRLVPRDLRGTFRWNAGVLTISSFEGSLGKGAVAGGAEIVTDNDPSFSAHAEITDALLSELAIDAGWGSDATKGRLVGRAELQGSTGRPETFQGTGHFELKEAAFVPVDFVRQIGELMAIEELQVLRLKTAVADFSVADAKVRTDKLLFESENLILEAKGPASFDGTLDLDARLHLNDRLRRDLRALIGDKLKPSKQPGYAFIPFNITGTVQQPRSDLIDKVAGARFGRDVGNLLKNLIRAAPAPAVPQSANPPKDGN